MKQKDKEKLLLVFLIVILIGLNYSFLDKILSNWLINYETGIVERVIDGDTLVVNSTSVRLLGINTPEKGEKYASEAKEFLEEKTLGKLIKMKSGKDDRDLYDRKLRYIFSDGNVNLELVRNGFANYYFPSGKDKYYDEFKSAWEKCLDDEINLCERSTDVCGSCIKLKTFSVGEQSLVLENTCSYPCDLTGWSIKDEGRKKYVFSDFELKDSVELIVGAGEDSDKTLFWERSSYVWTKSGDSLFLRDAEGKLVLFWGY